MARPRGNWTLDLKSISYLKTFDNQSKTIDEALELHKNKEKYVLKPVPRPVAEVKWIDA